MFCMQKVFAHLQEIRQQVMWRSSAQALGEPLPIRADTSELDGWNNNLSL